MSTNYYGIRIQKVEAKQRTLYIKVFVLQYNSQQKTHYPFPKDDSFFLRALWEKGSNTEKASICQVISSEQINDETWVNYNTYKYIKNAWLEDLKNTPINTEDWNYLDDSYKLKNGRWKNEKRLVQADFKVYVAHKKYLEHLKDGMTWDSTAYDTKSKSWTEIQWEKGTLFKR